MIDYGSQRDINIYKIRSELVLDKRKTTMVVRNSLESLINRFN